MTDLVSSYYARRQTIAELFLNPRIGARSGLPGFPGSMPAVHSLARRARRARSKTIGARLAVARIVLCLQA